MITRYRSRGVSLTLTGDLEAMARRMIAATAGASAKVMEAEAETIAQAARQKWYTLVERETGQSGDIQAVTTIDVDRGVVRVGIGSSDARTDRGRPVPAVVRSPGPGSLVEKRVDRQTYWSTPEALRSRYPFIFVRNPLAGRAVYLLEVLVKAPARKKIRELAPGLAAALRQRVEGKHG